MLPVIAKLNAILDTHAIKRVNGKAASHSTTTSAGQTLRTCFTDLVGLGYRLKDPANLEQRHIADLLLRAAWCCVDEGDVEAERYFRRHAAWAFERALSVFDGVGGDERAVLTYLVGELWRRIGDLQKAGEWFDRVADEIVDDSSQHWIIAAAERQRTNPQEWF